MLLDREINTVEKDLWTIRNTTADEESGLSVDKKVLPERGFAGCILQAGGFERKPVLRGGSAICGTILR